MKKQGLNSECLKVVFSSVVVSKTLYALPTWAGYISHDNINQLNKILVKGKRSGFTDTLLTVTDLLEQSDHSCFHVLSTQTTVHTTYYKIVLCVCVCDHIMTYM